MTIRNAMMPDPTMVLEATDPAVNAMVVAMMDGPRLGGGVRAHNNNSGNQSSNDFQLHYDVFPSRYDRGENLFRFVFTM